MTYSVHEQIQAYLGIEHHKRFPCNFEGFYYADIGDAINAKAQAGILRSKAIEFWQTNDLDTTHTRLVEKLRAVCMYTV